LGGARRAPARAAARRAVAAARRGVHGQHGTTGEPGRAGTHRRGRRRGPRRSVLRRAEHPRARAIVGRLMTPDIPFRDTFWNVPAWAQVALYAGAVVALASFAHGLWKRVALWRAGLPEDRFDRIPERLKLVARHGLGQVRTLSQAYPGVMHAIM